MMKEVKLYYELFQSLVSTYQVGLKILMRGSDFIFDCVHLLYCKYHKINPNCNESYKDSPDWIRNSNKKNNKCH